MLKIRKSFSTCLLMFFLVAGMVGAASAATLTVGSDWNWTGNTVQIPITVDNPATLAGAAFTITYSDSLTLQNVESTFFNTFAHQWEVLSPAPDPYPPSSVEVGGTLYDQPLLYNLEAGVGMLVAAARCMPADADGETTIFTLTFSLNDGAAAGIYPIDIIATTLRNADAGYNPDGETIPMLVGADLSVTDPTASGAFPILLGANGNPTEGSVTFYADVDNDNMGDAWEMEHFLTMDKDGTDDTDQDGYSDAMEFANETDPNVQDPSGGDGYNSSTDNRVGKGLSPGVIMLLLE